MLSPVAPAAAPLAFGDDDDELPELVDYSDDEEEGGNALAQQGQGGHDHHADCQHNLNQEIERTAPQKFVHVLVEDQIRTGASQESVVRAAKVIST